MTASVALPDGSALGDLKTFVGRARHVDPSGAVRLVAHGSVLAVYAAALHGGGAPTVLAMRVLALAEPSGADVTVPLAAMTDRFAHIERPSPVRPGARSGTGPVRLSLPPTTPTGATGAGMVPPRTGWSVEGVLRLPDLRQAARAGIAEVAAGTPEGAGSAAVARLRAMVWGRPLLGLGEVPAGTAFAAETFGFLGNRPGRGGDTEVFDQESDQDAVTVHRAGRWWRLSARRGHVLARPAMTLA